MVSLSTAEAQCIALAATDKAVFAIKRTFIQLKITADDSVQVHTDNQAVQDMLSEPFGTKQRKCIDPRPHLLQDRIMNGQMDIHHVPA